ncbi:MAG: 30S ribosomal protein S6 [Deltaproteobacteria bacterium]|jgi:small subunit ribosomal protein S6|nr:30S ribosomal protein S6 [Deltaproteobacteria bacterium]
MNYRRYETLILLSPNLNTTQIDAFKKKVEGIIADGNGAIVRIEEWGRRRLAYPVQKELHGYYILYDFRAQPALESELQRNCKIDEQVFKYLTILLENDFTDEKYKAVLDQLAAEANRREKEKEGASSGADKNLADSDDGNNDRDESDSQSDDDTGDDDDDDDDDDFDDEVSSN